MALEAEAAVTQPWTVKDGSPQKPKEGDGFSLKVLREYGLAIP